MKTNTRRKRNMKHLDGMVHYDTFFPLLKIMILVFNDDSLFRAYKKRLKDIPHYSEVYDKQIENPTVSIINI